MTSENNVPVEERLISLLQHLNVEKAHFAASASEALGRLLVVAPDVLASLVLVPARPESRRLSGLGSRLLIVYGDAGPSARGQDSVMADLPDARKVILEGYTHQIWSDIVADRPHEVLSAVLHFLENQAELPQLSSTDQEGEVAGLTYRVFGSGPPLVLLPLGLAASQWDPMLPSLAQRFTTIVLGGPNIGWTATLENRSSALLPPVSAVIDRLELRSGEHVLDVGCGTGVYDRWLAEHTAKNNPITAVDLSSFFIREARALAARTGLDSIIGFQEANAEALPFEDETFDASFSITVFEECDADKALRELIRVTKRGGRIGVLVRAVDLPNWVNVQVSPGIKAKVDSPPAPGTALVGELGCADASLYSRFRATGLTDVRMFPQWYTQDMEPTLSGAEAARRGLLTQEEQVEWRSAVDDARKAGTFFISLPCHCAVGRKPGAY